MIFRQYLRVKSCYSISPPFIIPTHFTFHYIEMRNERKYMSTFFLENARKNGQKIGGVWKNKGRKTGRVEEKGAKKRVSGEGFRLCHANQKINFAPPYISIPKF